MNKALIVSGGNVSKDHIHQMIKVNNYTYIIAADKGLESLYELDIVPSHIIGDFDSVDNKVLSKYSDKDIDIQRLNPEKDYTDTHMAFKLAIELGCEEVVMLGAIGNRIDHTIGNIHIMEEALENDIICKIVDKYNEVILINKDTKIEKDERYKYISLLPLTVEVKSVTLIGFKYKLKNRDLKIGESIGISNEQIKDKAIIKIKEGQLIVIKSRD